MNQKLLLCFALTTMIVTTIHSQSFEGTITNSGNTSRWGEIMQGNVVKGYYLFTSLDKVNKGIVSYEITLLDNNLNKSASFIVDRPETYILFEASFNNETFLFNFFDTKSKSMEYISFNRSGNQIGSIKREKLSNVEIAMIDAWQANPDWANMSIYPNGSNGFLMYNLVAGKKDGFAVGSYSNELKVKWIYTSDLNDNLIEHAAIAAYDGNYVSLLISKRPKLMSMKDITTYISLIDANSGKEIYNIKWLDHTGGELSILNSFILDGGAVLILGEYFAPGVDAITEKSEGLYIQQVESSGEYSKLKKYSWEKDISTLKRESQTAVDDDKFESKNLLYFHQIIRSSDGKIFAIAEEYKKQASALGIATSLVGGGALSEIKLGKMVILEFDQDFNLKKYTSIDKKERRVILPRGIGSASPQKIGLYLKYNGSFDYEFTAKDTEKDAFLCIYLDGDRTEAGNEEKAKLMIGSLNIIKGSLSNERFPLNSDADVIRLYNAKPGYIGIYEYTYKTKKVTFRLEKILN